MSHPKILKRYSAEWFGLFDAFKADPQKPIEIECGDQSKAQAMRLEFYKAREAFLRDEGMNLEYGEVLNSREVRVRGSKCIFDHKDKNWVGQLLQKALSGPEISH